MLSIQAIRSRTMVKKRNFSAVSTSRALRPSQASSRPFQASNTSRSVAWMLSALPPAYWAWRREAVSWNCWTWREENRESNHWIKLENLRLKKKSVAYFYMEVWRLKAVFTFNCWIVYIRVGFCLEVNHGPTCNLHNRYRRQFKASSAQTLRIRSPVFQLSKLTLFAYL